MNTFMDFIANSDFATGELTSIDITMALLISFGLGLIIFLVYRYTYSGVMYSTTFNVALIGLSMITSAIILAITSNIILSLGMVGALSIVRFRTAIKDPMDVVYMYFAIAVGIISGAKLIMLGVILTIIVSLVLIVFSKISLIHQPYLLVVEFESDEVEREIIECVKAEIKNYKLKSKIKNESGYEITLEVRSQKEITNLVNIIDKLPTVKNAALLSYDGNFVS